MSILQIARPPMQSSITWARWKQRWGSATDLPTRLGLLHSSLEATTETSDEDAERFCIILAIADGHSVGDEGKMDSEWYQCARKAFQIAYRLFTTRGILNFRDYQDTYIHPRELEAFFEFFKPDVQGRIKNASTIRHSFMEQSLDYFIGRVCEIVWEGRYCPRDSHATDKLRVIDILNARKQLKRLHSKWEDSEKFDEASLARLEELALRKGATVEEAVYNGSYVARSLVIIRLSIGEMERIRKRKELEQTIQRGQQELAKL